MNSDAKRVATTASTKTAPLAKAAPLLETTGIEIISDDQRTAKPSDLFWPWFAANVSVFGMSYGSYIMGFGINFVQATIISVIGVIISFFLCGLVAIAGKRGSAPTMVMSRAAFGVHGQRIPGIISWLTSIGWETSLTIAAVLATATVFEALGWATGTAVSLLATAVIAGIVVLASVLGYHTIVKLQSILTWLTGAMTVLFMFLTVPHIDFQTVMEVPAGSAQQMVGALVMVMTGFGLGWINIAADWSRYQKRSTPGAKIVAWNTAGGSVAPLILVVFGLLLAYSSTDLADAIGTDPIGALVSLLPLWALIPFWIVAVLTLISGAVLGIYSSGLTLLTLGVKIPRPVAAGLDGLILTAGTVYVVFFAENFIGPFQSFLVTLGVPIAAWAGILIADVALRKAAYDEHALFDPRGRYRAFDWVSLGTLVGASFLGWGLVINQYSDAPWNDWQGYLLGIVGGKEGAWAYSNLGVLLALILGFVVTYFARKSTVRQQEEQEKTA